MSTTRQPAGIPTGGEFSANAHDEVAPMVTPWVRQSAPLAEIHLSSLRYTAMNFTEGSIADKYDLNPPYQRGAVWTEQQRHDLMQSLISGIPIGAVITNQRSYTTSENERVFGSPHIYAVIDGKQRIETIQAFHRDEFAVPADWWSDRAIDPSRVSADGTVTYSALSDYGQRTFDMLPIPTEVAQVRSLRAEAMIFRLVNTGGTEQTEGDIARAASIEGKSND